MWTFKPSNKYKLHNHELVQVKFNHNDTCYLYDKEGTKTGWIPRDENPLASLSDGDVLEMMPGGILTQAYSAFDPEAKNFMINLATTDIEACDTLEGDRFHKEVADMKQTPLKEELERKVAELETLQAQYSRPPEPIKFYSTETGRMNCSDVPKPFPQNNLKKESMFTQILNTNKAAAEQAAVLETGRLANVTLKKIVAKRFPMIPETPFNALIVANLASVIATQIKPSPKLAKLTQAMVVQAYGEVYQLIDLEGMIAELLATVDLGETNEAE